MPVLSRPLTEISTIRGGYAGPDAVTDDPGPDRLRALQTRDLSIDGSIAWHGLAHSRPVRDGERYLINEGDVLLPLRSARLRALVARGVPSGIIAAGQWALITPQPGVVDPDYLASFLNHPATLARLSRVVQGGTLPFLSLAAIRAFEITVPLLDTQHHIARANALHARVTHLEQQTADARTRLVNAITMHAVLRPAVPTDAIHS